MTAGPLWFRLFRSPMGPVVWESAGYLGVGIERGGVAVVLSELGWRTEDGAETSLRLPELVGTQRSPAGEVWELRGEALPEAPVGIEAPADYRVFEGDNEQPIAQHPSNPLRLWWDHDAGHPVRLSWGSATGEGGYLAFAPRVQEGHLARVVDIQASAQHRDGIEVARNLVDGSAETKWFAPVSRAEVVVTLSAERTIVGYDLVSGNDAPDRDPRDWELLGLVGAGWEVLDTRHGEVFAGRLLSRNFSVDEPRSCARLRLRILGNAGSPHLQLSGLRLHTAEGTQPPPSLLGWYRRPGVDAVPLRGFLMAAPTPPPEARARPDREPAPAPMSSQQWRTWLAEYGDQWLRTADEDDRAELAATGFTRPSAGSAAIERTETLLGTRLPVSLRSFYEVTDGLLEAGAFGEQIVPLDAVGWLRDTAPYLLDSFGDDEELSPLLARALRFGHGEDGDYWFLDPDDTSGDEWAAYTWHPSDGDSPERHHGLLALLEEQRRSLATLRAHEGRPVSAEGADERLAEGRRLALAGDVDAARRALEGAMDGGRVEAFYLDAQIQLFTLPETWHESTLRNNVLGNDRLMDTMDDELLRGDLLPLYLAVSHPGQRHPTPAFVQRLAGFVPRIAAMPGCPSRRGEDYDAAWEAFAASLIVEPVPDPAPFGRICSVARDLVELGYSDDAWSILYHALRTWRPRHPLRVMPTILLIDPVLRTIMTEERRLLAAVTRDLA